MGQAFLMGQSGGGSKSQLGTYKFSGKTSAFVKTFTIPDVKLVENGAIIPLRSGSQGRGYAFVYALCENGVWTAKFRDGSDSNDQTVAITVQETSSGVKVTVSTGSYGFYYGLADNAFAVMYYVGG